MFYYAGSNFVLFRSCFQAKGSPFFGWQTRKLSATNQQWSLWLYTKHLMDMFPYFWIMRPSTFGKYSIFHSLQGFSANNFTFGNAILFIFFEAWKAIDSLMCVPNFLFSDVYLSLLFNFKIDPSLSLSYLMSSMFVIILIIRIKHYFNGGTWRKASLK